MARLIALEWDNREARVAIATKQPSGLVIEQAFNVPLATRDDKATAVAAVGDKISAALAARMIRKGDALVAVGRANIELRQLALPPGPDEELPDLVRFQSMREFHSLGEEWPLDFIPLPSEPGGWREVLAAAISPELVTQITDTCAVAGLTPQRLILRPCALASLFLRRRESQGERIRLLVDLLAEEADLTAVADQSVMFLRTAKLAGDVLAGPEGSRTLLAEIRRTIAAVQNQLKGQKVEAVYLCGAGPEHTALVERIGQELSVPARLFDPLEGLELSRELRNTPPANLGRFAPLLGLLLDEAESAWHAIDFLHPRRTPPPPSRRKPLVYGASAVATVAALAGIFIGGNVWSLNSRAAKLSAESRSLDKLVKDSDEMVRAVAEIEAWQKNDVVWLDELRELSARFPSAQDAMLTQLRFSINSQRSQKQPGGEIQLDGLVREAPVVDSLEAALDDALHSVKGQGREHDLKRQKYPWQFRSSVVVEKPVGRRQDAGGSLP